MNSSSSEKPALVKGELAWPRPYLSWTQYSVWLSSGESHYEYFRRYIYNEPLPTTPMMLLGLRMADMLEHPEIPQEDPMFEHYRNMLPHYEFREQDVRAEYAGVPLLAKPDGFTVQETTAFGGTAAPIELLPHIHLGEYKTGRSWDQHRADEHRQIDFYMLVLRKFYGIPAENIHPVIHWIPTFTVPGTRQIQPTGEIVDFPAPRTEDQLNLFGADVLKVWKEIGQFCYLEYKSLGRITA